ncbi:polysaccharide biosynthesis protein [Granulosicoccus sp. 3-233]|uniref:polysaccharide biosynthesis protein n=1 Tax=Granulosicoccus sp. 3-233 TaxID=3417969 RepID=UPI003D328B0D
MQQKVKQDSYVPTFVQVIARNLSATGRGKKQAISMLLDAFMVIVSLWAAYALRFGSFDVDIAHLSWHFILLTPLTVLIFTGLGIYRWVVRTSTFGLYLQLLKGACASSAALLAMFYLMPADGVQPRSAFLIYGLVLAMLCVGTRLTWKGLFNSDGKGAPVAIYGAGSAGTQLAGILKNGDEYSPVCFIDDNPGLSGSTVMGRPVLNGVGSNLAAQLAKYEVSEIIIAIPSVNSAQYSRIYDRVEDLGFPFKTSPSFVELVSGQAAISEIREVSVTDILGRNEVVPDPILLAAAIRGKSILVTGGGGSIGSELCRQIIKHRPARLTVLDNSEANLYHIEEELTELRRESGDLSEMEFDTVLCSVTDQRRIDRLFESLHFDTVYHAAAYKHVPMVENFPEQGIEVNVFGTLNLVNAAMRTKVDRFVFISTDKAVRPTSAMGATKRVAELVLQAKANMSDHTLISMVRFGNVLASNGSVVPKFRKQIAAGGPVTLTHRNITRYFMTIPEASQLVIQASAISSSGDVFVLDMGEPIMISHLAETMIRLHCQQVEQAGGTRPDIRIEVTGLRPGEKMYEELFLDDSCEQTSIDKVMSAHEQCLAWSELESDLTTLQEGLLDDKADALRTQLFSIVFRGAQAVETLASPKDKAGDTRQTSAGVAAMQH